MIPDSSAKLIWDARRAGERVTRFVAGKAFDDYIADEMLRSAVERQLGIVGDAMAALRRADPDLAAEIADLSRIIAFRNVLVHGYANVDDALVWSVVERSLPGLLEQLAVILAPAADISGADHTRSREPRDP